MFSESQLPHKSVNLVKVNNTLSLISTFLAAGDLLLSVRGRRRPPQRRRMIKVDVFVLRNQGVNLRIVRETRQRQRLTTLEITLGQMPPPKGRQPLRMPPESGGVPGRVHFWEVPFALQGYLTYKKTHPPMALP